MSFKFKMDRNKRIIKIKPILNRFNISKTVSSIYEILNRYEENFQIFIWGVPYCYFPDAFDHIIYKKRKSKNYVKISECSLCRLNKICPGIEKGSVFNDGLKILKPVLSVPNEIVFEVSNKCLLDCEMCVKKNKKDGLKVKTIFKAIDRAADIGVKNIRFTGGEPLIYPQIADLVKYSKNKGFYTIINSSLLCDRSFIKEIGSFIDDILVSVHGFDEESEFEITKKRFFKKKILNINYAIKNIKRVRIGSVITKKLIDNFEKYLIALPSGIKVWELYRPMVGKNFLISKPEFDLNIEDYKKLLTKIKKSKSGYKICIANPIPFCAFRPEERNFLLGGVFDDGYTRIIMDSKGYFKPSYYININLGTEISESWDNNLLKSITWERKMSERCDRCLWFLKCLGGSRYASYEKYGSYKSEDPLIKKL
ncbi:MAG TPA: radical SAM protein [Elusimicrobiales bacterium]|nr:radical SAM protein [Elusimicrobiales bacterium]HPO95635.1 radical SAM protein [Elusimicrobiales bacterium]